MYASNYAVTFTGRPTPFHGRVEIAEVFKEALGIHGAAFHELVDAFQQGQKVRVIINSDQFVQFFLLRRKHFGGRIIVWDDAELVSNPEVITDLSHLR